MHVGHSAQGGALPFFDQPVNRAVCSINQPRSASAQQHEPRRRPSCPDHPGFHSHALKLQVLHRIPAVAVNVYDPRLRFHEDPFQYRKVTRLILVVVGYRLGTIVPRRRYPGNRRRIATGMVHCDLFRHAGVGLLGWNDRVCDRLGGL